MKQCFVQEKQLRSYLAPLWFYFVLMLHSSYLVPPYVRQPTSTALIILIWLRCGHKITDVLTVSTLRRSRSKLYQKSRHVLPSTDRGGSGIRISSSSYCRMHLVGRERGLYFTSKNGYCISEIMRANVRSFSLVAFLEVEWMGLLCVEYVDGVFASLTEAALRGVVVKLSKSTGKAFFQAVFVNCSKQYVVGTKVVSTLNCTRKCCSRSGFVI